MKHQLLVSLVVSLLLLVTLASGSTGFAEPPSPPDVEQLRADAGGAIEITWNPQTNTPSFVGGAIPLGVVGLSQKEKSDPEATAFAILDRYAAIFGMTAPVQELQVEAAEVDEIGMTHVTLQQVYQGVVVYNATVKVHLSADGQTVAAIGNQYVPGIQLSSMKPAIAAEDALTAARLALPGGEVMSEPELVVYAQVAENPGASARLAWLVELRDDSVPVRNVYVVDATKGGILHVIERLYEQEGGNDSEVHGLVEPQAVDKIADTVWRATTDGEETEFFLILPAQPDLSHADQLTSKAAKGRYVYETLWKNAQVTQTPLKAWLSAQGIEYRSFYIVNALLVKGGRSLVVMAAQRNDVARIEANPKVHVLPELPSFPMDGLSADSPQTESGTNGIEPNILFSRSPAVWVLGYTGRGVVIGGQDTGYDWDHPALKTRYRGWNGSAADHNYNWHDSVHSGNAGCPHDSPEPCDDKKHGTHTMGTTLGSGGGSNRIGMAPDAKWIGCRNMDHGVGTPATYLECFEFFLAPYPVGGTPAQGRPDLAPDVTVNSWGCPVSEGCHWSTLQQAVEAQRAAGIMTVVSAGNDGPGCSTINNGPPALYDASYTVGALRMGTNDLASFSSRGPVTSDGSSRRKPDITAPGTGIRSSIPGGGYEGGWQGTSMAGPHVAGAVALLWSARPDLIGQIDATENYLNNSAIHLTVNNACSSSGSPNNLFGYGRLDTLAAVREAKSMAGGHRYRETYNANHGTSLPGELARIEGQTAVGDRDVDNAHDFAGVTYDYFKNTHNRDSFDNLGATIISTAHYGRNYQNAFWNGTQMVYGDGFPVKDVIAHELTHAVTERTANLEYEWQSGALNESLSDIFGVMVDRDDWLMGEDLPEDALGGREAIRDLANPKRFGQPDHVRDWNTDCSDHQGVHTNSGIPNKAFYNIATHAAVGKDKAERIFFRTLTRYLQANSSLEDARAKAIQSATDLYASDTAVINAVRDGFNAVGLDGQWNPPSNSCGCAATVALDDAAVYPDRSSALETAATLYRVRDRMLDPSPTGRYYRSLYEQYTGRASYLMLIDPSLRAQGGAVLSEFTLGLAQWVDSNGEQVVLSQAMVTHLESFLQNLAQADRASGKGNLAAVIVQEMVRVNLAHLAGMTFAQAWEEIGSARAGRTIYLPTILR